MHKLLTIIPLIFLFGTSSSVAIADIVTFGEEQIEVMGEDTTPSTDCDRLASTILDPYRTEDAALILTDQVTSVIETCANDLQSFPESPRLQALTAFAIGQNRNGTASDHNKALELANRSAEQGYVLGIAMRGILNMGTGGDLQSRLASTRDHIIAASMGSEGIQYRLMELVSNEEVKQLLDWPLLEGWMITGTKNREVPQMVVYGACLQYQVNCFSDEVDVSHIFSIVRNRGSKLGLYLHVGKIMLSVNEENITDHFFSARIREAMLRMIEYTNEMSVFDKRTGLYYEIVRYISIISALVTGGHWDYVHELAIGWLEKQAALGSPLAMNHMANLYHCGVGVERDRERAKELLEQVLSFDLAAWQLTVNQNKFENDRVCSDILRG